MRCGHAAAVAGRDFRGGGGLLEARRAARRMANPRGVREGALPGVALWRGTASVILRPIGQ